MKKKVMAGFMAGMMALGAMAGTAVSYTHLELDSTKKLEVKYSNDGKNYTTDSKATVDEMCIRDRFHTGRKSDRRVRR